jgi:hypothetical protein
MATELSSGAISSILEAVPGIATVLRSPVADAIVNLSRSACQLQPFDPKDAHELIKYAVRRGLIRSDEGDRVAAEVNAAVAARAEKNAQREAARTERAASKKPRATAKKATNHHAHHAARPKPKSKVKKK